MLWHPLSVCLVAATLCGAAPRPPVVPPAAQASDHFDVEAATNAWLDTIPREQKIRSDAYFEGSYTLFLLDPIWLASAMLLLLETRFSARMRDFAERVVKIRWLQTWIYWTEFCTASSLLVLPLTIYEGFLRERNYGLMDQTFAGWFGDQLLAFAVIGLFLGGVGFVLLATTVRRLPQSWPFWGALVATLLGVLVAFIGPVFLDPLFNTYKPLPEGQIRSAVLSLARANGISATEVYEENASKQSKRVSAFVSGFGKTERITLNDNLLNRVSPQGVMSVMGHEMGHYVMHHIATTILLSPMVFGAALGLLWVALHRATRRFGRRWGVRDVSDVALLPFAVIVLAGLGLLFTPISNTFTRNQEYEADLYGLNAARQPDGEAEVDLLLGEYRKLDPSPIEEFLFYDHPSGRARIHAAMRWKAENLCLFRQTMNCSSVSTQ
jgi:STE24 endopeptidase